MITCSSLRSARSKRVTVRPSFLRFSRSKRVTACRALRYAIVIEKAESNFPAYVPDLPGCVATGSTVEEAESQVREAIKFHLDGMQEDGIPIPQPASRVDYVEIAA